jgi:purine-binding chemotaxis protein CheW
MTDRGSPFRNGSSTEDTPGQQRQGAAETLQEALRSLGSSQPGSASPGALTPDAILDLARRAGLTNSGQVADLSRIIGAGSAASGVDFAGVPQHIVFALEDLECALPAEAVQGVERITDITLVPNMVAWVLGVIHVRGAILSVVDLRGFFGLPTQSVTSRSRLLVVTKGDMTIGVVVDAVTEMRPLDGPAVATSSVPTPEWAVPYAQRTISLEGRTVVLLDPERLLRAEKMHRYRADFG